MGRCGQSVTSTPRGGDRRICQEPRYVSALKNVSIEYIAAGDAHTLALSKNGRVFAWGAGADGQCGQGHIGNLFIPKGIREIYFEDEKNDDSKKEKTIEANIKVESEVAMEEEMLSQDMGLTRNDKRIVRIRAAGCYSAALSVNGDIYTWGYGGGVAMGHPIPDDPMDVPMLPLLEGNQYSYSTSAKTYPEGHNEADNIRDCVSFDTELNVLMPRRLEIIHQLGLHVEDVSLGPGHMVVVCSMPSASDNDEKEHFAETAIETSDNNQTSDTDEVTDEVSSGDLGQLDSTDVAPDSAPDVAPDPPLNDSMNTGSTTAEAASNISISQESIESSSIPKAEKRHLGGFLAKMKSSRSNRDMSVPNEASPPGAGKEKKKSFRLFNRIGGK